MKIYYFSWLRNRLGIPYEDVNDLPSSVITIKDLITWLSKKSATYKAVFANPDIIHVSINGEVVNDWHKKRINYEDKIAFFSPMAGG